VIQPSFRNAHAIPFDLEVNPNPVFHGAFFCRESSIVNREIVAGYQFPVTGFCIKRLAFANCLLPIAY
jgi:hypothetical protein